MSDDNLKKRPEEMKQEPRTVSPELKARQRQAADFKNPNSTSEICKVVIKWIQDFEATVDEDHEFWVRLVNFGEKTQFNLKQIDYSSSPLVLFKGITETGQPVELIQHISQISILLTKLPRENPKVPKKPTEFTSEAS
jgi:hypothetical protein